MKLNITKFNLKLKYKIQAIIITISAVVFLGAIGYISTKAKNEAYNNAVRLIDAQSEKYGNQIQGLINEDFAVVRTLGNAFKAYNFLPKEEWQSLIQIMYKEVFRAHPTFTRCGTAGSYNTLTLPGRNLTAGLQTQLSVKTIK